MNKNFFPVVCLAGLLAFAAFMETPGVLLKKDQGTLQVSLDQSQANKKEKKILIPFLESKLVDTKEDNGYIVEKYQEFEIYTDLNGTVIKSVPTSKFDYLRYKENQ